MIAARLHIQGSAPLAPHDNKQRHMRRELM